MRHILFGSTTDSLEIALLIKETSFSQTELEQHYIQPIKESVSSDKICAFTLKYDDPKKVKASTAKEYLGNLLKALDSLGIKTLLVADGSYFKVLTKERKAEPHYGYVKQCKIKGFEHFSVILAPNYQAMFYNPAVKDKLDMALDTLVQHTTGKVRELGAEIIKGAHYPKDTESIRDSLQKLLEIPELTCDIETTDLRFNKAELGTIAFAWDKHHGVAFPIHEMYVGTKDSETIHQMLKDFFTQYVGKLWFHNALFDAKILIYRLFMKHSTDYKGMRQGLEVFQDVQDTQILSYLAQNSTAEIKLGLKENAFEFAGNYAMEEINDIRKIPLDDLLKYNLIDCLATWYVYDKYLSVCEAEEQMHVYNTIFQPSIAVLLEMMLIGLPMDLDKVHQAKVELETIRQEAMGVLRSSSDVKKLTFQLQIEAMRKANAKLKKKVKSIDEFRDIQFNPGSTKQKQKLLYEFWKYPVIDVTDTKAPATGAKTLEKLLNQAKNEEHARVLQAMIDISKVSIILDTFISAFEKMAFTRNDGTVWLNGNLKLGGTQSGRLSSNSPNLQNIPSGSTFAKLIKSCFVAPEGWLFAGADFSALEDRIGAILSGDKNKIREFSEGIDGHSLRCLAFFSKLPEPVKVKSTLIDPAVLQKYDMDDVQSVNQVKKDLPEYRQEAKAPSFALQYGGTWHTLVKNIGLPETVAKSIENGYHELYSGLSTFSKKNMEHGSKFGFVECAFGLRLRTPILAKTILGKSTTPYEAESEGRSASNAVTQSWGMLMNRALIATAKRLKGSGFEQKIFFSNTIHDAGYFIIKDEPEVIKWLNDALIEEMRWNAHPRIYSEEVPMEAELDIGHSWDKMETLKNNATLDEIVASRKEINGSGTPVHRHHSIPAEEQTPSGGSNLRQVA